MFEFFNRRPDFLIIGAQKGGTTALQAYLQQHPNVQCAKEKEVGFFNRDIIYNRGEQWYAKQFPFRRRTGLKYFEATPGYLYHPFVAERIFRFSPELKLIALLRNPVKRAYSAWNMFRLFHSDPKCKAGIIRKFFDDANPDAKVPYVELLNRPEFPGFHECITREMEIYNQNPEETGKMHWFVRGGIYWQQLKRYLDLFDRKNLLIMESEELKTDRTAVLNRVTAFLGLSEHDWSQANLKDSHVRKYSSPIADEDRKILQEFYQPHNIKLFSLIGQDYNW